MDKILKDLQVVIDYLEPTSDLRKSMEKIREILEEKQEEDFDEDDFREDPREAAEREHEDYLLSSQYDHDCKYEKWDWLKNESG